MDAKLYLCATPIGNLEDITLRVLKILAAVDCIYCEDTRRTLGLLRHYDIKKPLYACHEHNEQQRAAEIVARVQGGAAVAYVSDAGMPGISDPGAILVAACLKESLPFEVLPGASAALTALVLSGLPAVDACFVGFLPRTGPARRERIAGIARHPGTLILYESPLRLAVTCGELADALGERPAALVRELTKLHEECLRGSLLSLQARFSETPPRGECVLLVGGKRGESEGLDAEAMLRRLLAEGLRPKDAAKQVAALTDMSRNEAYSRALALLSE